MMVLDFIRINDDYEYVVRGTPYDNFNSAWDAALGCWQRSRYGLPSDNTNMSDSDILAMIGQQVNELVATHGQD